MTVSWSGIQLLIVLVVLTGQALAGEIYTWTDGDGNVHITDRPPAKDHAPNETVIRYSSPSKPVAPSAPVPQETAASVQESDRLKRHLTLLEQRKTQIEEIIEQNQVTIATAEKEAAIYRRRSGSYARRNVQIIERQLLVLRDNLLTYQSDLNFVKADIAETKKALKRTKVNTNRPMDPPVSPIPPTR